MIDIDESEFWSATEQLKLIHAWARARYVAPWALLLAVLLRVSVSTSHRVMLPGPPAPASLNMGIVLVGRSGSGKGVTDKLSRAVWPADIHEEGLGSGQGIHELFKETKNPEDRITRALISVSEIDHFAALNAGQGNNTRAAIKAALTGDRLGSKGASAATTRSVPADSYRLGLSISAQFGHCGVLLDDVSGGTPQRLVWGSVTDPSIPDTPGPEPDRVLDTKLPAWALADQQVLIQYGTPDIAEYVAAGLLANQRGELDAIDGHRTLTRLKVAAALAILDHRSVVSELDWQLSEVIMAKSDATRQAVMDYDRQAARAKIRDRAVARATGEEFYENSRALTVRNSILRMLERDGEQSGSDLRRRLGTREKRDLFDRVISSLTAEGLVVEIPGEQRGSRYKASGHGDQGGHPMYPQVKDGDQGGHGDQSATVTNLDSRRSHESERPKVSCQKWFDRHVEQLIAAGATRVESFAVITAGQAAGYTKHQIHTAASAHPTLKALGRGQWSLTGEHDPYPSTDDFISAYIDRLPANATEIDRDHFRAAGEAAGYAWEALRKAIRNQPRITSTMGPNAVWRITDPQEGTA